MADQFYVPQRTPPAPQFQPPTDLVNAYLNRPTGYQIGSKDIGEGINAYLQNKYKQQELKQGAFKAGGPYLMELLYGQGQQASNTPAGTTAGQVPPPPQTPLTAQATTPGQVAGQAPPSNQSQGQPGQAPQGGYASPIEASVHGLGHPDFTGMLGQAQQYQNMGDYGREQTQNLVSQGQLAMLPQTAAKNDADIRSANAKFSTPEQGAAVATGDPDAISKAYGGNAPLEAYQYAGNKQMEKNKTITGEVGKLTQQKTEVKTLQGMFDNLDKGLHSYYKDPKSFIGSGNLYQVTKGRAGSASGANVLNQGKPLVASLNQILTHRFNMGESQLLNDALAPSTNDTPQYAASKMKMLHQIIGAMDTGNKDNINAVMEAINGQLAGMRQ